MESRSQSTIIRQLHGITNFGGKDMEKSRSSYLVASASLLPQLSRHHPLA
jgi:hypothetical protein